MAERSLKFVFVPLSALFALLLYVSPSQSQFLHQSQPQSQPPAGLSVADSLLQNFYVRSCCAATINDCMRSRPQCAAAPRLAAFVRWMDSTEAPAERMPQLLQARYNSFAESRKHNLNTIGWPVIGDPNSPMTVVMYFSSTCPACKTNFREILPMVTDGHLKGKAKIVVKPFGNNFGNRAIVAAYDMGRFTDFMLALAQAGVRVDEELIYDIADGMLFDRDVFRQRVESDDVAGRVEESSTEASGTGATHVPTYFIEGRRYDSVLFARWVADAIEFVHDAEFKK